MYPEISKSLAYGDGLTVPWGNVFNTGESSFAPILTVAPPSPTTTYLFLETVGGSSSSSKGGADQHVRNADILFQRGQRRERTYEACITYLWVGGWVMREGIFVLLVRWWVGGWVGKIRARLA